jgi:hypothetical protein
VTDRGDGGKWLTGSSGNPAGRPRNEDLHAKVKRLSQKWSVSALHTLREIYLNKDAPYAARVAAAQAMLNRAWGTPGPGLAFEMATLGADGRPSVMRVEFISSADGRPALPLALPMPLPGNVVPLHPLQ